MPCYRYKDPEYKTKWARKFAKEHPDLARERSSRYYQKTKERAAARAKARRLRIQHTPEFKEYRRKEWMRRKYGISPERYNQLHSLQKGLCAICGKEEETRWRRLAVDHNHATSDVRGLLCFKCNMMLAYFEDSIWSKKASEYLSRYTKD